MSGADRRETYSPRADTRSQWVYLLEPPGDSPRIGLSLSGGGIRSAAFSAGAIQRLVDRKYFERVDHLAAVSGGTYIAGAMSITSAFSDKAALSGFPWTHGSPEERGLRLKTTYLTSGVKDSFWLVSNFLYGLALNLGTLALGMSLIGRLVGIALGSSLCKDSASTRPCTMTDNSVIVLVGGVLACLLVILVLVASRRRWDSPARQLTERGAAAFQTWNTRLWYLVILLVALLLLPELLSAVGDVTHRFRPWVLRVFGDKIPPIFHRVPLALIVMTCLAAAGGAAFWLGKVLRRPRLFAPVAAIAGPGLLITPMLFSIESSLEDGVEVSEHLWFVIGSLLLIAIVSVVAHNRRYSLHLFYRERLQSAFGFARTIDTSGEITCRSVPYMDELLLSEIGDRLKGGADERKLPNVIYCASVAADRSEVPYRRNASSYTFESDWSGSPLIGYTRTEALEKVRGAGGTELTIPSIMAISGAAASPMMGRFSDPALSFLMAMLNVRLGVWLPHPRKLGPEMLGRFDRFLEALREQIKETSIPASSDKWTERLHAVADYLYYGWIEPGPLYVLYEAIGRARARGRFVHVSDGGHWENLGLVELIRRRCTNIVVVDASAPGSSLEEELARAARLANAELGVELTVELSTMQPVTDREGTGERLPANPFARGKITYPDGEESSFILIRSMLWEDAPFELKRFQDFDPQFPHHPTQNQFFSGEQFDAYRQLGWAAATYVAETDMPVRASTELRQEGRIITDE